jgi:hypothetical protein
LIFSHDKPHGLQDLLMIRAVETHVDGQVERRGDCSCKPIYGENRVNVRSCVRMLNESDAPGFIIGAPRVMAHYDTGLLSVGVCE